MFIQLDSDALIVAQQPRFMTRNDMKYRFNTSLSALHRETIDDDKNCKNELKSKSRRIKEH